MTHPLATDLVEFVDEQPADRRSTLGHIVACEPCRRAIVSIIETNPAYPDLFGRPPGERLWICEDCAWPWPLNGAPPSGAECDHCGGSFIRDES